MNETQSNIGPWLFAGLCLLALMLGMAARAVSDAIRDAAWVDACYSTNLLPDEDGMFHDQTRGFPECGDVRREETHPR